MRDLNTYRINWEIESLCNSNRVKWNQYQRNGVVKGLKNRDGWAYLWSKQMKESVAPIPNLSNFEKLENSEGIKNFNELGIAIPSSLKFFIPSEFSNFSKFDKLGIGATDSFICLDHK